MSNFLVTLSLHLLLKRSAEIVLICYKIYLIHGIKVSDHRTGSQENMYRQWVQIKGVLSRYHSIYFKKLNFCVQLKITI